MLKWHKLKNPLAVAYNFVLIQFSKYIPSLPAKEFALRFTGMKIGKGTGIGLAVQFDIFFPELIEIDDNSIIGYGTTLLAHEFLQNEFRTGEIKIGKNAMIGTNCTILPGVDIGDGAVVSAMSLINCDVPAGKTYGGVPAREIIQPLNRNQ